MYYVPIYIRIDMRIFFLQISHLTIVTHEVYVCRLLLSRYALDILSKSLNPLIPVLKLQNAESYLFINSTLLPRLE